MDLDIADVLGLIVRVIFSGNFLYFELSILWRFFKYIQYLNYCWKDYADRLLRNFHGFLFVGC